MGSHSGKQRINEKPQQAKEIDKGQRKKAQEQWNVMLKSAITRPSTSGTKSWEDVVKEEEKRIPARKASI
ncbi:hypothetical protein RDI58_026922 [Solanum bulbocastanum]|uniref:Uncharacterized protein n=1 Tax=Solanum bulbocastanum TaxID=147425 RepID=A0AAN8SZW1_SOLBU